MPSAKALPTSPSGSQAAEAQTAPAWAKGTGSLDVAVASALGGAFLTGNFGFLTNCGAVALIVTAAINFGLVQKLNGRAGAAHGAAWGIWDMSHAVASVAMVAAMGFLSCASLVAKAPISLSLAAAVSTMGAVALAPARQKAHPRMVYLQAGCAIGLLMFGLCLTWEFYTPIALVSVLGIGFAVVKDAQRRFSARVEALRPENQFVAALDGMNQGLAMFDGASRFLAGNKAFLDLFGVKREASSECRLDEWLVARFADRLQDKADVQRLADMRDEAVAKRRRLSALVAFADGRAMELTFQAMPLGFSLLVDDVTQRREAEIRVERLARQDDVTGLSNRIHFRESLDAALARRRADLAAFAVMVVDLDRFKQVNDSLGHPAGDRLLKLVGERLQKIAAPEDRIARLGSDQFVLLRVGAREDAGLFASAAVKALSQPYRLDNNRLMIGASIGIAMAPEDGASGDQLLNAADMALYAAKEAGRGAYRFFEAAMAEKARRRRLIEVDLRVGIARGELEVHYQPIVSIAKRRICGCEALVRWRHPTQGLISPAEFIPVAEESGLIAPLGEWVLRQACLDAKSWPREIALAVNFSAVQFSRGNVVEMVKRILRETKFPPARLEMEITESVLMNDADSVLASIDVLRDLGMRVALDDFGTGYSSLSYLSRFRPNKVKIDQTFVRDMAANGAALAIIKAVKALVYELGVDLLVEGVETLEQLDIVREHGADEAQGYLFSKPRPAREIAQLIADPAQLIRGRKLILPPCAPWMKRCERVNPMVVSQMQ